MCKHSDFCLGSLKIESNKKKSEHDTQYIIILLERLKVKGYKERFIFENNWLPLLSYNSSSVRVTSTIFWITWERNVVQEIGLCTTIQPQHASMSTTKRMWTQ